MSCGIKLEARRNADFRVTFTPASRNFTFSGMTPLFSVRLGEDVLLQVGPTATINGSSFVVLGDSVVLTIEQADLALLDSAAPDTSSEDLFYDVTLTDQTGFENWIVGGPFILLGINDISCGGCSESVEVSLGGACVQISIEGGNIGAGASVSLQQLNQAVADAEQSAAEAGTAGAEAGAIAGASAGATSGASAGATAGSISGQAAAEAVVASKADQDFSNVDPLSGRTALDAAYSNAPVTSNFLEGDGASINRLGDRVFIGGANANDGNFPNVGKDWLTTFEVANGRPNGILVSAQAAVLTNDNPGARVALVVAARTSTVSADTGHAQSLSFSAVQDRTSSLIPITAGYAEAWRTNASAGAVTALELNTINKGDYRPITPWLQDTKMSVALQLAAGGEFVTQDGSAAINVRNNGAKFGAALMVGHNAISGSDGATGTGHAIQLAARHQISWYNAAGENTSGVFGGVTDLTKKTRLVFNNSGTSILGPTDATLARFDPVPSAVNYFSFQAATTGGGVVISAIGSDANVSLRLLPQGTGVVSLAGGALSEGRLTVQGALRLGARTNVADAPIVGYMTIESNDGGVQKVALIA